MALANFTAYGKNDDYSISVTMGEDQGRRAHLFVADISDTGAVNYFVCRFSGTVTSYSVQLYANTSAPPYSYFPRPFMGYISVNATSYYEGQIIYRQAGQTWDAAIRAADSYGVVKGLRTDSEIQAAEEITYDYILRLRDIDGTSLTVWRDLATTATSKRWDLEDYQPTKAGYTFKGWSLTAGGEVYRQPTGTWLQVYGGDDTLYAVWEKITIPLLYWDGSSGTQDADIIKKGEVFSNLKAERWNAMNAKIKLLNSAYTYSTVTAHVSRMTAELFNDARAGIQNLTGHGVLPAAAVVNATVKASYFQASTACLKTALNSAITYYNNL